MPVFDFRCISCGHEAEVVLLPNEQRPTKCPKCSGEWTRLFTGRLATQFNAWGFSRTDGWVADRPTRGDFKTVKQKAGELFD